MPEEVLVAKHKSQHRKDSATQCRHIQHISLHYMWRNSWKGEVLKLKLQLFSYSCHYGTLNS